MKKIRIRFYTRKNNIQSQKLMVIKEYYENKKLVFAKILFEM